MSGDNLPAVQPNGGAPARVQLGGTMAMQQTIDDLNTIRQFVGREMRDGLDFGTIPGTGGKPTLLQPGAQKILMYFNAYPDFETQTVALDSGHVEYIVKTRLYSRASQAVIGTGIGSASTMESKYRWRNASRSCPKCGAGAIIEGKPEYGGGWVCYGKKGGCGAKFRKDDAAVTGQVVGRVENPDIHDQRNTVLKMAKKRSLVDSAHGLGCMSELFTQDLDDFHDTSPAEPAGEAPGQPPREPAADRREVNRTFPPRETRRVYEAPEDDGPAPTPQATPWAVYVRDRVDRAKKAWLTEMAVAGIAPDVQAHPDFAMPNEHEVTNHFVSHAIKSGAITAEAIAKDGKDNVRDPKKAKAAMADLYAKAPKRIRAAVDEYFLAKEKALRVKLGMDDLDEPSDEAQAEPAEVGAREAGCDDE